jgi:ribokinase
VSRVLVAGAINTDLVARLKVLPEAGETVTGQSFAVFGGGKGANQAFAAARSGADTVMLGALGNDDFGKQRLADLTAEGIDVSFVATTDQAASGVALIFVEDSGQNRIAYIPGSTLTVTPEQAINAIRQARPSVLLTTLELPLPTLAALYAEARALGATIITNATPEPAAGREVAARADILIVNETEAAELLGIQQGQRPWHEVARSLRDLGPATVVVTLGKAGAAVETADSSEQIAAPNVEVVDSTGAGDAFAGAFAAHLAGGGNVRSAAQTGVRAGSIAVTKAGAQPSMPTLAEIERLRGST